MDHHRVGRERDDGAVSGRVLIKPRKEADMAEKVKKAVAIKRYFCEGSSNPPSLREIKEFMEACSSEEFTDLARQAAKQLGLELEE